MQVSEIGGQVFTGRQRFRWSDLTVKQPTKEKPRILHPVHGD
jgi:hypothetical protein